MLPIALICIEVCVATTGKLYKLSSMLSNVLHSLDFWAITLSFFYSMENGLILLYSALNMFLPSLLAFLQSNM